MAKGKRDTLGKTISKSRYEKRTELLKKQAIAIGLISVFGGLCAEYLVNAVASLCGRATDVVDWVHVFIWLGVVLGALLCLGRSLRELQSMNQDMGTYYYIHTQSPTFLAWHFDQVSENVPDSIDFKAINRFVAAPSEGQRVYDLSAELKSMSGELERLTNLDDDHSIFKLAPDLLWPLAFRIGNEWYPRGIIKFVELNPDDKHKVVNNTEWEYKNEKPEDWDNAASKAASSHYCYYPSYVDYAPRESVAEPVSIRSGAELFEQLTHNEAPKRVKVHIMLGEFRNNFDPASSAPPLVGEKVAVEGRIPVGDYDVLRIVGITNRAPIARGEKRGEALQLRRVRLVGDTGEEPQARAGEVYQETGVHIVEMGGNQLSQLVAKAIFDALEEFPNATIDLLLQVPKSVAFASGMLITRRRTTARDWKNEPMNKASDYWSRLRLVHYDGMCHPPCSHWMITHPIEKEEAERGKAMYKEFLTSPPDPDHQSSTENRKTSGVTHASD